MKIRAYIIHGWDGHPNEGWFPWLKKELEKIGFEAIVPQMPMKHRPHIKRWVPHLQTIIKNPDENTYLVGHSAGCITILRWLETLQPEQKIGGAILVAGFTDDLGYQELSNYFKTPIHWARIRKHCKKFITIHSDDDPYIPLKHGKIFKRNLKAKLIIRSKMKHFSGGEGCTKLPDVLQVLWNISKK